MIPNNNRGPTTIESKLMAVIDLKEMLEYKRPEGSVHQRKFCNRYLLPVMGGPDNFGNYIKIVGDKPKVAFMAHHDTVHKETGKQKVNYKAGFYSVDADCLGADCTAGVYLILKMIEANVPGVYVVHAGEEIGCVGSSKLVKSKPSWLDHVDFAISFDRKGYGSIITHQLGIRTCSDEFAESLAFILDLEYEADTTGAYTDSNEYRGVVAECTNISVGYFNQHTKSEVQDRVFLDMLCEKLIAADWSMLAKVRNPEYEYNSWDEDYYQDFYNRFSGFTSGKSNTGKQTAGTTTFNTFGKNGWETKTVERKVDKDDVDEFWPYDQEDEKDESDIYHMTQVVRENPKIIAHILSDLGYNVYDLIDEIQDIEAKIRPVRGYS